MDQRVGSGLDASELGWNSNLLWPDRSAIGPESKLLGALALTLTFTYLIYNVWEPGHPGSMLALLVSFVALIGSTWDIAERPAAAAAVGAVGAAVALSKVNVGAFLLIAAVFWILMRSTSGKSRYGRFVLYASLVALPWVLMGSLTALPWALMGRPLAEQSSSVVHFALMFDIVIIGVFAAMESTPRTIVRSNALIALIIGSRRSFDHCTNSNRLARYFPRWLCFRCSSRSHEASRGNFPRGDVGLAFVHSSLRSTCARSRFLPSPAFQSLSLWNYFGKVFGDRRPVRLLVNAFIYGSGRSDLWP